MMSNLNPADAELRTELLGLRDGGFLNRINGVNRLLDVLRCSGARTPQEKASRFVTLLDVVINDSHRVEVLLAAMGLLEGYENIKGLDDRRLHYYEHGYPAEKWKRPKDSLRDIEDRVISKFIDRIRNKNVNIDAIVKKSPKAFTPPKPQYREKILSIAAHLQKSPFAQYVDSEQPLIVTLSAYDYRARYIPFCFRQKEITHLDQFCADARLVAWWAIVGGGGAGKSRLAYEYMQARSSSEWKILFLREEFFAQAGGGGKYQQFDDWSHPKNLLLIVDYVQRYSKAVPQWIESLIAKKSDGNKIRILLLERTGEDGLWYRDFAERPGLVEYKYDSLLELPPLCDAALRLFAQSYAEVKEKELNEDDINNAINILSEIDGDRRVLYFIMLLDMAFDQESGQVGTSEIELLDYVLSREIQTIKARFNGNIKGFKDYMRLLIYATVTNGISLTDPPEWLQDRCQNIFDEFPDAVSAQKAMAVYDGTLRPYTPDLIGEFFVLTCTKEYYPFNTDVEWFIKHAWDNSPNELIDFILRIDADFYENEKAVGKAWLDKAIDGPITDNARSYRAYYDFLFLLLPCNTAAPMMSLEKCTRKIEDIYERYHCAEHITEAEQRLKNVQLIWDGYEDLSLGVDMLVTLIDNIDYIIKLALDKRDIIYSCAQILHGISCMQSGKPYSWKTDVAGKEMDILKQTTRSLFILTQFTFYKDNADIAVMFTEAASKSIRLFSFEHNEWFISYIRERMEMHDSDIMRDHYAKCLEDLAAWKVVLYGEKNPAG